MARLVREVKEMPAKADAWAKQHPRLGWYLVIFLALNWALDIGQLIGL